MKKISSHRVTKNYMLLQRAPLMPVRVLGKTGLRIKAFGLGGQALLEIEGRQKEAYDLINRALDLGINYFDTAPAYGPSRFYLGQSLGSRRKDIVLASKVKERDYAGAKKELDESFKLLKTSYIDILQLHSIQNQKDKRALKKDGALQVLVEAKKAGKIGNIGFTGHYDPQIMMEFMDEFDFDTVLMACNPAVMEFNDAVEKARSKNMGVIAMKTMSRGILPLVFSAEDLLHYALNRSDVAIIGCTDQSDVEKNILSASSFMNHDVAFPIPEELKRKAAYFMKGNEKEKWPATYQPDFPNIKYE